MATYSRLDNGKLLFSLSQFLKVTFFSFFFKYHGEVFGFQNLYIIDSSTNPLCISFLKHTRDILGANVIFSNANLNELENIMTKIGSILGGSADFVVKVDTDEFLTVM